jgi:predicted Zn-dependent peptidase
VDRPGAAQSEIRVGRVAVDRATPDYFPLTVLNTVLGGSFTSRLNSTLREEKGYTYGAGSGFSMRTEPGPFVASAAVHTPVTDSAVVEFLREIRRIREEPVPEEELERAKRYVALRQPQRFETVGDVAARLSEMVLYELPADYWAEYVERTLAVDAAEVQRVAREHLDPDRMIVVVAGDRAVIEAPLRALGMPVVVLPPAADPGSTRKDGAIP